MIRVRRQHTVRVTKVKGHATKADVQQGKVREEDRLGNDQADAAADLGGRHQTEVVVDVRRPLHNARNCQYFIVLQLHKFIVAVSRVAVNRYGRGGSVPDPLA